MSQGANEMGQGEGTLTRAAGLVSEAKVDFDRLSTSLEGQILGVQGKWAGAGGQAFFNLQQAWTQKQAVITRALNDFEASLTSTEKLNMSTDDAQSANFAAYSSKLG